MGCIVTAYIPWQWSTQTEAIAHLQHANGSVVHKCLRYYATLGKRLMVSWTDIRLRLREIANRHTAIPYDDGCSEWLAIRDDDDIHCDVPPSIFAVPDHVVMICWTVRVVSIVHNPNTYLVIPAVETGQYSNGYTVRREWFESLSPRQKQLVGKDHGHAHRYVDFAGKQYLFRPDIIGGEAVTHPASLTAAKVNNDTITLPTVEALRQFMRSEAASSHYVMDMLTMWENLLNCSLSPLM